MKIQSYHILKFPVTIVLSMLLIISSCKDRNESTAESTIAQSNASTPNIDINSAAITGDMQALLQNMAAGSDINEKDAGSGSTPLINTSLFGHTEMAKALIDAGADLNLQNNEGSTALITAAYFGHPDIVRLLLNNRADKTIKNNHGQTAYESVHAPFENVRADYDRLGKMYEPVGLKLNYQYIEKTRIVVEEMLKYD